MKLCKLGKELRGDLRGDLRGELRDELEELDEDFLRVRDLERGDDIYYIYLFFEWCMIRKYMNASAVIHKKLMWRGITREDRLHR